MEIVVVSYRGDEEKTGHWLALNMFPANIGKHSYMNIKFIAQSGEPVSEEPGNFFLYRYQISKDGKLSIWNLTESAVIAAIKSGLNGKVNTGKWVNEVKITADTNELSEYIKKINPEQMFGDLVGDFYRLSQEQSTKSTGIASALGENMDAPVDPEKERSARLGWGERNLAITDHFLVRQAIEAGCDLERATMLTGIFAMFRAERTRTIALLHSGGISRDEMRQRARDQKASKDQALARILTPRELAALNEDAADFSTSKILETMPSLEGHYTEKLGLRVVNVPISQLPKAALSNRYKLSVNILLPEKTLIKASIYELGLKVAIRNQDPSARPMPLPIALREVYWEGQKEEQQNRPVNERLKGWLRPLMGSAGMNEDGTIDFVSHMAIAHTFDSMPITDMKFETGLIRTNNELIIPLPLKPNNEGKHRLVIDFVEIHAFGDLLLEEKTDEYYSKFVPISTYEEQIHEGVCRAYVPVTCEEGAEGLPILKAVFNIQLKLDNKPDSLDTTSSTDSITGITTTLTKNKDSSLTVTKTDKYGKVVSVEKIIRSEETVPTKGPNSQITRVAHETSDTIAKHKMDDVKKTTHEGISVVEGNTSLALELYGQLAKKEGNLFISPYSISTALAMLFAGAREDTEKQMAQTLHFELGQDSIHAGFADLEAQINNIQDQGSIELNVANALWVHQDYPILQDFLDVTTKNYHAGVYNVDFVNATEETRLEINSWVEKKTKDKIKELIKKDKINSLTRLVLTNAIYFKGQWESLFKKKWTKEKPFRLSADKSVDVPLMTQTHEYGYVQNDKVQVIELPYAGGDLSMIVLLPNEVNGLAQLEDDLNVESLHSWMDSLREMKIEVHLPKFKMSSEFELSNVLSIMGMKDAFDPQMADFSGISHRQLIISAVIHKTFVDVNEEGTEAAAATAVRGKNGGPPVPPVPVFRADHPFVFIIRHNASGSILFIGRVASPILGTPSIANPKIPIKGEETSK